MGLNWSLVSINVNLNMWKISLKSKHIIQVGSGQSWVIRSSFKLRWHKNLLNFAFSFSPLIFLFLPVD